EISVGRFVHAGDGLRGGGRRALGGAALALALGATFRTRPDLWYRDSQRALFIIPAAGRRSALRARKLEAGSAGRAGDRLDVLALVRSARADLCAVERRAGARGRGWIVGRGAGRRSLLSRRQKRFVAEAAGERESGARVDVQGRARGLEGSL